MPMTAREYAMMFKALSDETRLQIFAMLSSREICACDILEQIDISQPTLSYHMKLLCGSGLVHSRRDGAWMRYTLNTDCITAAQAFLQQEKDRLDSERSQSNEARPSRNR